jgi:hypothetical protein
MSLETLHDQAKLVAAAVYDDCPYDLSATRTLGKKASVLVTLVFHPRSSGADAVKYEANSATEEIACGAIAGQILDELKAQCRDLEMRLGQRHKALEGVGKVDAAFAMPVADDAKLDTKKTTKKG